MIPYLRNFKGSIKDMNSDMNIELIIGQAPSDHQYYIYTRTDHTARQLLQQMDLALLQLTPLPNCHFRAVGKILFTTRLAGLGTFRRHDTSSRTHPHPLLGPSTRITRHDGLGPDLPQPRAPFEGFTLEKTFSAGNPSLQT